MPDKFLELNHTCLKGADRRQYEMLLQSPVTVLQVGEGNFLRGFFDWMIHECRKKGLFQGSIAVTQPRPSGKKNIETIRRQDGLYTLVVRGLEQGEPVERKEIVSVFSKVIDPYSNWSELLDLAKSPDLQFVVSNTTEAGIVYRPEPFIKGKPIESFPGRLTVFLYHRFLAFNGAADRGLILLPTELLERNGDELRSCVLLYSKNWGLPDEFIHWVKHHNRFLNTLVDRIVTGYPSDQANEWFEEWGYRDGMLNTAEPYHFWAIEAEPELEEKLPLRRSGLNVRWVKDLKPYQLRKVRILNGAHTLMTPIGILHGLAQVSEVMEHADFGAFVRGAVEQEIIPSIPLDSSDLQDYASSVYERFLNPYIHHRLSDIAMNSVSKFKVRLLPSLEFYSERGQRLPDRLIRAFAGLLRFYKVKLTEAGYEGAAFDGTSYLVRDDSRVLEIFRTIWAEAELQKQSLVQTIKLLLASVEVWDKDLSVIEGLTDSISAHLIEMERKYY